MDRFISPIWTILEQRFGAFCQWIQYLLANCFLLSVCIQYMINSIFANLRDTRFVLFLCMFLGCFFILVVVFPVIWHWLSFPLSSNVNSLALGQSYVRIHLGYRWMVWVPISFRVHSLTLNNHTSASEITLKTKTKQSISNREPFTCFYGCTPPVVYFMKWTGRRISYIIESTRKAYFSSSTLPEIDPDTAYVVCVSVSGICIPLFSLYGIRIPLFALYGNAAQTIERHGHCSR